MSEPSLPHSIKELNRLHVAGNYAQLIEADRENLAVLRSEFGSDHKYVGVGISHLARSLYENGNFAEAENQLLGWIVANTAGNDELKERKAVFLMDLANIYFETGRDQEAAAAVERAGELMATLSVVSPKKKAILIYHSARIEFRRGEFAESERHLKQAIDLIRNESAPKNRALGVFLHRLSQVYAAQGRLADAMEAMGLALNSYPARETAYYANSLSMLGWYLFKQGDATEARSHQYKALEILKRVCPPGNRDILATERRLAAILDEKSGEGAAGSGQK